jgi:predicted amidohydrolase YtcJ
MRTPSVYAEFQDQVKGSITAGKLADLVLLSQDIFKIDPKEIENVKVVLTMVDGRVVYEERERE